MSKPIGKINRIICARQVLDALTHLLRRWLPLELRNTRLTPDDLIFVLSFACMHRISVESACAELASAPSGNRFREVLTQALPKRPVLQRALNTILRQQLPRILLKGKRAYSVAIDLTLIPYHGQPQESDKELVRGEAKSGTTHFHGYATVAIVHSHRRYVLALRFVEAGDKMATIVRELLDRLKSLKIKVRRVYLDKGFCSVEVLRALDRRHLAYIVPIPVRGKSGGVRKLFAGRISCWTTYTLSSATAGCYTVQAVSVRRYCKGRYNRHGVKWFAYAAAGLPAGTAPRQVFELYRQRFGIETSYRQMNQVRARTTSRNPALRLLLIGLAFILVNLYVALRAPLMSLPTKTAVPARRFWFSLRRLAFLLGRAVEQQLGVAGVIQLAYSPVLS